MNKNFETKSENVKDIADQMVIETTKIQTRYVCVNEKLRDILFNSNSLYISPILSEGKGIGTIAGLMIYLDETLPNNAPLFNVKDF